MSKPKRGKRHSGSWGKRPSGSARSSAHFKRNDGKHKREKPAETPPSDNLPLAVRGRRDINWYESAAFPVQKLTDHLRDEGFSVNGVETLLKIHQFVHRISSHRLIRFSKLRFQIGALVCKNKEEQQRFCAVFNNFVKWYVPNAKKKNKRPPRSSYPGRPPRPTRPPHSDTHATVPTPDTLEYEAAGAADPLKATAPLTAEQQIHAARQEPVCIQIVLPQNTESIWDWASVEPLARVLREKETTLVEEVDIPATIYKTIRSGGSPQFVQRHRKKWQDYLFLIEQHSEKDHLAAYYTELVVALQRMDINAEYFYFNHTPAFVWKERRKTSACIPVEHLFNDYAGSKVFIIAAPDVLLERPSLKPSRLAVKIRQVWMHIGLLNMRPVSDWNTEEEALSYFIPVVPGNLIGMQSLFRQWETHLVHTPQHWKLHMPEPAVPASADSEADDDPEKVLRDITIYLGKAGFFLLCAVALFPQMYWELTKSYRDTLYPVIPVADRDLKKKGWHALLLRISRLPWFRYGSIPVEIRTLLRQKRDYDSYVPIRERLIELLSKNVQPEGSYAEAERFFALALLSFEKNIKVRPHENNQLVELLENQLRSQQIHFSEISDAAGRSAYETILGRPPAHQPINEGTANPEEAKTIEALNQMARDALRSGDTALARFELEGAKRDYELALSSAESVSNLQVVAQAQQKLAQISSKEGDAYTASGYLEARVQTLKELGNSEKIAEAQWELAKTQMEAGELEEARKMFVSAIQIFARLNLYEKARAAEMDMADLEKEAGNIPAALSILQKIMREMVETDPLTAIVRQKIEDLRSELSTAPQQQSPAAPRYIQFNNTHPSKSKAWERIREAFREGTLVKGVIEHRLVKGGLVVTVENLEVFLPGSQADLSILPDLTVFFGMESLFKVVKLHEHLRNAVVSRKEVLLLSIHGKRSEILNNLAIGQVMEGRVKNITDFGAFIDLGGVDGLVYITDLAWGRIEHPRSIVRLNETLQVKIIDFTPDKKRIALSVKDLQTPPWQKIPEHIFVGATVEARIVNIEDYGVFVELVPGIEGLIHYTELSWTERITGKNELSKKYKKEEKVQVKIVTINREERKIAVSLKQVSEDPLPKIIVGARYTGIVKQMTNYGVFIVLENGLEGMVHISHLSWTKRYAHPAEFTAVGAALEVLVINIDTKSRKIDFSHKQLFENPWERYVAKYPQGSYLEAPVIRMEDKGAVVLVDGELEAFVPRNHMKKEDGSTLNAGETAMFKVIEISAEDKKMLLSHRRYLEEQKNQT